MSDKKVASSPPLSSSHHHQEADGGEQQSDELAEMIDSAGTIIFNTIIAKPKNFAVCVDGSQNG